MILTQDHISYHISTARASAGMILTQYHISYQYRTLPARQCTCITVHVPAICYSNHLLCHQLSIATKYLQWTCNNQNSQQLTCWPNHIPAVCYRNIDYRYIIYFQNPYHKTHNQMSRYCHYLNQCCLQTYYNPSNKLQ